MHCAGKMTEQKQITAPADFVTLFATKFTKNCVFLTIN